MTTVTQDGAVAHGLSDFLIPGNLVSANGRTSGPYCGTVLSNEVTEWVPFPVQLQCTQLQCTHCSAHSYSTHTAGSADWGPGAQPGYVLSLAVWISRKPGSLPLKTKINVQDAIA